MKLIIREYLASLRERGELDAILPDLLSQLGLNVYSRPARGTRQNGVDVAAVGSLDGGPEKVYLFSIKPGHLTRKDWSSDSVQSLRSSLTEILDAYITNRVPVEHRDKEIAICIALGGDVQEPARELLTGFIQQHTSDAVKFEEWNGDKLAELIQSYFLREDLLPTDARSLLRKSLALIDEPDASYRHFSALVQSLSAATTVKSADQVRILRQISICLWILFSWAREAGNTESAYLSGEFALLHAWNIAKHYVGEPTKDAEAVADALSSVFRAYIQICAQFLSDILPHIGKLHAISTAVRPSCGLDVNLKLFDLLGRIATAGIWACWGSLHSPKDQPEFNQAMLNEAAGYDLAIKALIVSNPTLLLPVKDDQSIDVSIALLLLARDKHNYDDIRSWLTEMLNRSAFALQVNGRYPCILESYADLLLHPKRDDAEYRKNVTSASVLYPLIALYSAFIGDLENYSHVARVRKEQLQNCNFQLWYPNDRSEECFYTNSDLHGAALSEINVEQSGEEFLAQVFGECERSPQFNDLTAVRNGWWPLIVIACRHYRLPLPIHLLKRWSDGESTGKGTA
jgi:hypothetical protein